jgi:hypothetical protein
LLNLIEKRFKSYFQVKAWLQGKNIPYEESDQITMRGAYTRIRQWYQANATRLIGSFPELVENLPQEMEENLAIA